MRDRSKTSGEVMDISRQWPRTSDECKSRYTIRDMRSVSFQVTWTVEVG